MQSLLAAFLGAGLGEFIEEVFVDFAENVAGGFFQGIAVEGFEQVISRRGSKPR